MRFTRGEMSPTDKLPWNWDYSNEDVFSGDPITSADVKDWDGNAVANLTVGAPAYSSPIVQTVISDPVYTALPKVYYLRCVAQNASGKKRTAFLELTVRIPTPDPVT
jgi:hypothetical protein